MQRIVRLAILALAALVLAEGAAAQGVPEIDPDQPVSLVADDVSYDSERGVLTASGNVEVYYGPRTLTAERITYNDRTGRIAAEGEIVLRDATGATVFAEFADLDADLRDGLVRGAKAMLGENTRLSAVEARRIEDRYNVLSRAVYSPCEVCADEPTPLWRIRARRVVHDQQERMIHYEDARLEFFGVPVLWTPYFSHPDPTVERKTGFLTPSFTSSGNYGQAAKLPFYWAIDAQSDLTLTPFVTTDEGIIGEVDYRRAFAAGNLRLRASVTRSDFAGEDEWHGHVDSQGSFRAGERIDWGWDIKFASDDDYLRFFDFSNEDRLTSRLFVERYTAESFFDVQGLRFQSLRDGEPFGTIPLVLPLVEARHDIADPWAGGTFGVTASAQSLYRTEGEDTARLSLGLDWAREVVLPMGLAVEGFGEVRGDLFLTRDAADEDEDLVGRLAPLAGVTMRYPLIAETAFGEGMQVSHVLEPIAQAIVAPYGGNDPDIPNEDSLITEFDETNLFDRSHFSGVDAVEEGPRFNLGLRYALMGAGPLGFDATVGRVLRLRDADEFSTGSGLRNAQSDWVASWSARYDPYVTLRHRLRLGAEDLDVTRNALSLGLRVDPVRLSADYVFLDADPVADAPEDREEISARLALDITDEWAVTGSLRHDLEEERFVFLGGGIRFRNECCSLSAFVRRNFTRTDTVDASTSFGVRLELLTLGGGGGELPGAGLYDGNDS